MKPESPAAYRVMAGAINPNQCRTHAFSRQKCAVIKHAFLQYMLHLSANCLIAARPPPSLFCSAPPTPQNFTCLPALASLLLKPDLLGSYQARPNQSMQELQGPPSRFAPHRTPSPSLRTGLPAEQRPMANKHREGNDVMNFENVVKQCLKLNLNHLLLTGSYQARPNQ